MPCGNAEYWTKYGDSDHWTKCGNADYCTKLHHTCSLLRVVTEQQRQRQQQQQQQQKTGCVGCSQCKRRVNPPSLPLFPPYFLYLGERKHFSSWKEEEQCCNWQKLGKVHGAFNLLRAAKKKKKNYPCLCSEAMGPKRSSQPTTHS